MASSGCEYERLRAEKMRQNQLKLNSLGVKDASAAMRAAVPPAKQKPRPKRRREQGPAEASRRSARNEGKPAPTYRPVPEEREAQPKQARPRARARAGCGSGGSIRAGIDPSQFPVSTLEAQQAAEDAAIALAEKLNTKAGQDIAAAKVMQVSNVSGGFWLQNPLCITNAFHPAPAHMIHLECAEPCQSGHGFQHNLADQPDRWEVKFLPRGSGSGMSGGWIHFSIDHGLTTNDTVVFEAVTDAKPMFVRMHIFRAELVGDS